MLYKQLHLRARIQLQIQVEVTRNSTHRILHQYVGVPVKNQELSRYVPADDKNLFTVPKGVLLFLSLDAITSDEQGNQMNGGTIEGTQHCNRIDHALQVIESLEVKRLSIALLVVEADKAFKVASLAK